MTKFANKTFSSPANNQAYRDNFDSVFGEEPKDTISMAHGATADEQPKDHRFPCDVCGKLIWRGWFAPGVVGAPPSKVKCGACSTPPRDEAPAPEAFRG